MKIARKTLNDIVEILMTHPDAKRVTKYMSPLATVKGTRQGKLYRRADSRPDSWGVQTTILITIGRPNYAERQFIKKAKKAGEPFPVKKYQIKWRKK